MHTAFNWLVLHIYSLIAIAHKEVTRNADFNIHNNLQILKGTVNFQLNTCSKKAFPAITI